MKPKEHTMKRAQAQTKVAFHGSQNRANSRTNSTNHGPTIRSFGSPSSSSRKARHLADLEQSEFTVTYPRTDFEAGRKWVSRGASRHKTKIVDK